MKWGSLDDVERWYKSEKDPKLACKLNAIRLLMKGYKRKDVAEVVGVCKATVRNWRARWDEGGKEFLKSRSIGSWSKVTNDMRAEIEEIVEIKREINGRTVTAIAITGWLKKNTD